MSTLPVTAPVQTPTSARDARADRFLARVAALTPAQWGELDAAGQRLDDADPIAWWRNADWAAALVSRPEVPWLEDVARGVSFVLLGVRGVTSRITSIGRRRAEPTRPPFERMRNRTPANPDGLALLARIETLWDVAATQPAGVGASLHVLVMALIALWLRDDLTPKGFARAYGPVDPVIPAATL